MQNKRPYALSIAGFDPSAGAGLLADIKTFECNEVYGLGVVSALTWQNDIEFNKVEWIDTHKIISQIEILLSRFEIKYIKIGLIENLNVLQQIVAYLHKEITEPIIIFDPILKASAGFVFHSIQNNDLIQQLLKGLYCITPNIPESNALFGEDYLEKKLLEISTDINIYLKGGHARNSIVEDLLYSNKTIFTFANTRIEGGEKHGSGCILSAALLAQLALGNSLNIAAQKAKEYTWQALASNSSLLAYHTKTRTHETN